MVDFKFYINKQGIRGRKGNKGDTGFSPTISVETETLNEYTLNIQNETDNFVTPNLRGNRIITNNGGTYLRYDPDTEQITADLMDIATGEQIGGVRLATDADITSISTDCIMTPADVADSLPRYLIPANEKVTINQDPDTSLTTIGIDTSSENQRIDEVNARVDALQTEVGGKGDVTQAGNNKFTGDNTFSKGIQVNAVDTPFIKDNNSIGWISSDGGEFEHEGEKLQLTNRYIEVMSNAGDTLTNGKFRDIVLSASGDIVLKPADYKNPNDMAIITEDDRPFGIKDGDGNFILTQANIKAGANITVKPTRDGVEVSSTGTSGGNSKSGAQGDYLVQYGIVDAPNGLPTFTPDTTDITIPAGLEIITPPDKDQTTIASPIKYTVKSHSDCTIFIAQGEVLEAQMVAYQTEEPQNGQFSYLAWYNPDNPTKKWQFKSNDTGNVWREADNATPIMDVKMTGEVISRLDFIGYRHENTTVYATKELVDHNVTEITENAENIGLLSNRVGKLEDGTKVPQFTSIDIYKPDKSEYKTLASFGTGLVDTYGTSQIGGRLSIGDSVSPTMFNTKELYVKNYDFDLGKDVASRVLHQGNITAGAGITITKDEHIGIIISADNQTGGGDVTQAGNNTFTGTNTLQNDLVIKNTGSNPSIIFKQFNNERTSITQKAIDTDSRGLEITATTFQLGSGTNPVLMYYGNFGAIKVQPQEIYLGSSTAQTGLYVNTITGNCTVRESSQVYDVITAKNFVQFCKDNAEAIKTALGL